MWMGATLHITPSIPSFVRGCRFGAALLSFSRVYLGLPGVIDPHEDISLYSITLVYTSHLPSFPPSLWKYQPTSSVDPVFVSRLHCRLYCINNPRSPSRPREARKIAGEDPSRGFFLSYSLVDCVYLHRAALSLGLNCITVRSATLADATSHMQHWKPNRYGKWISPGLHIRTRRFSPLSLSLSYSSIFLPLCTYSLNSYFEGNFSRAFSSWFACVWFITRAREDRYIYRERIAFVTRWKEISFWGGNVKYMPTWVKNFRLGVNAEFIYQTIYEFFFPVCLLSFCVSRRHSSRVKADWIKRIRSESEEMDKRDSCIKPRKSWEQEWRLIRQDIRIRKLYLRIPPDCWQIVRSFVAREIVASVANNKYIGRGEEWKFNKPTTPLRPNLTTREIIHEANGTNYLNLPQCQRTWPKSNPVSWAWSIWTRNAWAYNDIHDKHK